MNKSHWLDHRRGNLIFFHQFQFIGVTQSDVQLPEGSVLVCLSVTWQPGDVISFASHPLKAN